MTRKTGGSGLTLACGELVSLATTSSAGAGRNGNETVPREAEDQRFSFHNTSPPEQGLWLTCSADKMALHEEEKL